MKPITIDYRACAITLSSAFERKAFTPGTSEYAQLMEVRHEFPDFCLATRQFKTNTKQERYKGLTYDFMREYIKKVEGKDARDVLAELEALIDISKCHSKGRRYPTIKKWFLDCYPEVAEFGMTEDEFEEYRISKLVEAESAELKEKISA